MKQRPAIPKPPWIRVRLPHGEAFERVRQLVRKGSLHTVCEEARCPNMAECWGCGTATFLILGGVCTRNCGFCAVATGSPASVRPEEPTEVARAISAMELRHAVITSVTRDDLEDGGASVFAAVIREVHDRLSGCTVEVLVPDFQGRKIALETVVEARPDILGHNLETVPRLYPVARPQADYDRSLQVLRTAKEQAPGILTKSGIMLGLGEDKEEIHRVMEDLRAVDCDILTLGQYLCPSARHLPVRRYYTPDEFESFGRTARSMGFPWVESAPLVRSSYHAAEQARELTSSSSKSRSPFAQ
ncbi:MAG: lipoyl synthase [Syntrophobacteraceae bacterium]